MNTTLPMMSKMTACIKFTFCKAFAIIRYKHVNLKICLLLLIISCHSVGISLLLKSNGKPIPHIMSTRNSYEHYFSYKNWQHIWNSYFGKCLLLLGLNIWVFIICSFTKSIFSLPGFFSQSTIFISKVQGR